MDDHLVADMNTDNGGVHPNSDVPNHAAYLIVQGGTHAHNYTTEDGVVTRITVNGIGRSKAEQIYCKALTEHLFSTATFMDGRDPCSAPARSSWAGLASA